MRARDAIADNPTLVEESYFIIDEYQDFNKTEEQLIDNLFKGAKGVLVVGDDDQTLYEALKQSGPKLIRDRYSDTSMVNAMLPFCGRCQHHIVACATYFIEQNADAGRVPKIFLPVKRDSDAPKVQIVASAHPNASAEYIAVWIEKHRADIESRATELKAGRETEPYLLILSPANKIGEFYRTRLEPILKEFTVARSNLSEDYFKAATYYAAADKPQNNFALRKVLSYETTAADDVHRLLVEAIQRGGSLHEIENDSVQQALAKCHKVKALLDDAANVATNLHTLVVLLTIVDEARFGDELKRHPIGGHVDQIDEQQTEEELGGEDQPSAIAIMSIVGAKGLSAEHVMIVGCDNVNMGKLSPKAFYVALTRGRKSAHLLTALQMTGARAAHSFIDDLPDDHVAFLKYTKKDGAAPVKGRLGFNGFIKACNSFSGKKKRQ